MTKKKKGFFKFMFSLMPGAGEMYMGFYKQGVSIMGTFLFIFMVAVTVNLGPLLILLPLLWFYSFFHVHNLSALSDEEFYSLSDNYAFNFDDAWIQKLFHTEKARRMFAVILMVLGASALWNNFTNMLSNILPTFYYDYIQPIFYYVPQVLFSVVLILLGIFLIRGKKKELEDYPAIEQKGEQ